MGPAGASGGTASVMLPPGQMGAANSLGNIAQPLIDLSMNGGAGTPAAWAYPQSQDIWQQYLYPGNAAGQQAMSGAYGAAGQAPQMLGASAAGLSYAPQALAQGFDPAYTNAVNAIGSNPMYGPALDAAWTAYGQGQQGSSNMMGMADSIMNQGFDPQSALFNQTQGHLMDQLNAANAAAGLGGTPYGGGVMGNALGNFDINWQNQQLGRQTQAAGAASPLYQAAPQLAASTGQMPNNVFLGQQNAVLQALAARDAAASRGASNYGSLLGSSGAGIGASSQLAGLPYGASSTMGSNALSGLSNTTNLGNNQYLLPQQMMSDLMQYMGLGQNASVINGNLGQMGFNQTAQGLGGLLGGANSLLGTNSLLGGTSGIFGSGGLFGAPAASAASGLGTAASSGFGSGLMGALPMAASV